MIDADIDDRDLERRRINSVSDSAALSGLEYAMATVIRTTIDELHEALAPFDRSRRVSVVVEDATESEQCEQLKRSIEAADDDPVDRSAEEVFEGIRQRLKAKYGSNP